MKILRNFNDMKQNLNASGFENIQILKVQVFFFFSKKRRKLV